ncbi:hypothetical protein ACIPSJ_51580 [Streptomyces sp. NPDC090088]|uniref:hypothetical protein n=1 Tax=Streptomyces sp. NPDC090088 TaxID=3365944 RepID=UPI00382FEFE7
MPLAAVLGETEVHLAGLTTARKVIEDMPIAAADTDQRLLVAFNDHPQQPFRAHELLGLPAKPP